MSDHFGAYSQYYDLLYQNKDYPGEVAYIESLLREHGSDVKDLLELGCGTGIHAELLAQRGFDVTGVELSQRMFERATARAEQLKLTDCPGSFQLHSGDARNFSIDQQFDAVISLFHVVSYQVTNQDVCQMFATASNHLKPGGLFMFDVWYGPAVLSMKPAVRIKRIENDQSEICRIAEPEIDFNANRVDVQYTILVTDKQTQAVNQFSETHPMRYYFVPELELLAAQHQMKLRHCEEWITGNAPSDQTWGVTFVLQKATAT